MTTILHDFDEAFRNLTRFLEKNLGTKNNFSLPEEIIKPFESTIAPTTTDLLNDFVKLFGGEHRKGLFFRLDGPSIYLVVSTVLQFPPCPKLTRTVSFFMEILGIFKDENKAIEKLQLYSEGPDLMREVRKRQKYIFLQVLARAKGLLFDESKHLKVRKLAGKLIYALCEDHPNAWRNLLRDRSTGSFGSLLRYSNDYALRLIVADIIRHLMNQQIDMHDIWDGADEYAMDYPRSLQIDANVVKTTLSMMSRMNLHRAFTERDSRIYHVAELEIAAQRLCFADSNTLLTIDDELTIFTPDRTGKAFITYEVPVTEMVALGGTASKEDSSTIEIIAKQDKGYLLHNGQKKAIRQIQLRFLNNESCADFVQSFNHTHNRLLRSSRPTSSQQNEAQLNAEKTSVKVINLLSEDEEDDQVTQEDDTALHVTKVSGASIQQPQISSDFDVQQADHSSDVFARTDQPDSDADTGLTKFLRASQSLNQGDAVLPCDPLLPASECEDDASSGSSPLKKLGKRKRVADPGQGAGAMSMQNDMWVGNHTLSLPLQPANDPDLAAFQNITASVIISAQDSAVRPVAGARPGKVHDRSSGIDHSKIGSLNDTLKIPSARQSELESESEMPNGLNRKRAVQAVQSDDHFEDETGNSSPSAKRKKPLNAKAGRSGLTKVSRETLLKATTSLSDRSGVKSPSRENQKENREKKQVRTRQPRSAEVEEVEVEQEEAYHIHHENDSLPSERTPVVAKQKPSKVLKDRTNTARNSTRKPQKVSTLTQKRKVAAKKTVSKPAEATAALTRSKRTTARTRANYVESSGSEVEEQNASGEPREAFVNSRSKDRSSKAVEGESIGVEESSTTTQRAEEDRGQIDVQSENDGEDVFDVPLADAVTNNVTTPSRVKVPSSDPIHITEQEETQPHRIDKTDLVKSLEVEGDSANEEVIAEDSYPARNEEQSKAGDIDKSFGSKLGDFAMTAPKHPPSKPVSERTSFGNDKQFVDNVNAAKKTSKPKPDTNGLPAQLKLGKNHAFGVTSNARKKSTSQSRDKSTSDEASRVTSTVSIEGESARPAEKESVSDPSESAPTTNRFETQQRAEAHGDNPVTVNKAIVVEDGDGIQHNDDDETTPDGDLVSYRMGSDTARGVTTDLTHRALDIPETQSQSFTAYRGAESAVNEDISTNVQTHLEAGLRLGPVSSETTVLSTNTAGITVHLGKPPNVTSYRAINEELGLPDAVKQLRDAGKQSKLIEMQERPAAKRKAVKNLSTTASRSRESLEGSRKFSIIHFGDVGPENQGSPTKLKNSSTVQPRRSRGPSIVSKDIQANRQSFSAAADDESHDNYVDDADDTGIVVEDMPALVAPSSNVNTPSREDTLRSGRRNAAAAVDGQPNPSLSVPEANLPKRPIFVAQAVNNDDDNDIVRARHSPGEATEDIQLTTSVSELTPEQESEFVDTRTSLESSPELRPQQAIRRSLSSTAEASPEEANKSEQAGVCRQRVPPKATNNMAQVIMQRPQRPDDISFYVRQKHPNAREKIALQKAAQTSGLSRPTTALHFTNVFDAHDHVQRGYLPSLRHEKTHTKQSEADLPPRQFLLPNTINENTSKSTEVFHMDPPPNPSTKPQLLHDARQQQDRSFPSNQGINIFRRVPQPPPICERTTASNEISGIVVRRLPPTTDPPTPIPADERSAKRTPQSYAAQLCGTASPPLRQDDVQPTHIRHKLAERTSDDGVTTLVEHSERSQEVARRLSLTLPNDRTNKIASSPETEAQSILNKCGQTASTSDEVVLHSDQSLRRTMTAAVEDLFLQLAHERDGVKALVDQFRNGGNVHLAGISKSAHDMVKHDSEKLTIALRQIHHRVQKTKDVLAGAPEHRTDNLLNSRDMESREKSLLAIFNNVQC